MIEMVLNYDVTFAKIFTIWLRVNLKDMTHISPSKWYYTNLIMTIQLNLITESWNAAVLDSGATNTGARESWFKCYKH